MLLYLHNSLKSNIPLASRVLTISVTMIINKFYTVTITFQVICPQVTTIFRKFSMANNSVTWSHMISKTKHRQQQYRT